MECYSNPLKVFYGGTIRKPFYVLLCGSYVCPFLFVLLLSLIKVSENQREEKLAPCPMSFFDFFWRDMGGVCDTSRPLDNTRAAAVTFLYAAATRQPFYFLPRRFSVCRLYLHRLTYKRVTVTGIKLLPHY